MIKILKLTLVSIIFSFALSSKAQDASSIVSVEPKCKAGKEAQYIYTPRKGLLLPKKIEVIVLYEINNQYNKRILSVTKTNKNYSFSFKAPKGTAILIFGIIDAKSKVLRTNSLTVSKKTIVDNNEDAGFIMPLLDSIDRYYRYENISLANLIYNLGEYELQLQTSIEKLVAKYEDAYKLYPELRHYDTYPNYLSLLYKLKKDSVQSALTTYAEEMVSSKEDEMSWLKARRIFRLLKMDEQQKKIELKILGAFPKGKLAQDNFWDIFNTRDNAEKTEQSLLSTMQKYISMYGDSSTELRDKFYKEIIWQLATEKKWNNLLRYESIVNDKMIVPAIYNSVAWELANKKNDNSTEDLNIAKMLSKRAIDKIKFLIKRNSNISDFNEDPKAVQDMFINTYALILYKLGKFDSAFLYQNSIYKKGKDFLDTEGLERYATYAEKAKGINFTRNFLEGQLLAGTNSIKIVSQLQSIYKKLGLPENELIDLQKNNSLLIEKRNTEIIKKIFGTTKGKDFKLQNLEGVNVALSSFKNKIIVLDFWATWCGPCKASFPYMQSLVNKYKNDTRVVFLFIDVWERVSFEKNKKNVKEFISANKYDFNVLFDLNGEVANDYKVEGIPATFIIDKKGDVIFMSNEMKDDIGQIIETNKAFIKEQYMYDVIRNAEPD